MSTFNFTTSLFLKPYKINQKGKAPVYVRILLEGKKYEISTNKRISLTQWDQKHKKVYNSHTATEDNRFFEAIVAKINNAYSKMYVANEKITIGKIKSFLSGDSVKKRKSLLEVAEEHNANFKSLIGIKYSSGSYKNYKTTYIFLKEFIPQVIKRVDIPLEEVDYKFCEQYFKWLTTRKTCHRNGANKHIQRLKKIINFSIKHGYTNQNRLLNFSTLTKPPERIALTIEEVKLLQSRKFNNRTLEDVKNVFLFQCFTGLSYADVKVLSSRHLKDGLDGKCWIEMSRTKTGNSFKVPLLLQASNILKLYSFDVAAGLDRPLLPVLSNQKMNSNLKSIQEILCFDKTLTSHLGRHTFATSITLLHGVPIETVSKMLGHTNLRTTQLYAKVVDRKIAEDMERLSSKIEI